MFKIIKSLIISLALILTPLALTTTTVSALNLGDGGVRGGVNSAKGQDQPTDLFGDAGIFKKITNMMLFMIGVLSVIMLIVGGMHYVISGGKKESVTAAKNTILYAIIGLIVSLMAYAIIDFVINIFVEGGDYSGTNV